MSQAGPFETRLPMYIAQIKNRTKITYILRESIPFGRKIISHDLFDLGPSPAAWINYPGGNAWYVDPDMEARVSRASNDFDSDDLEALFWPWIRPDIKQAVETFQNRSGSNSKPRLTPLEKEVILKATHAFDKRRAHFLKFGNMDQGHLANMPAVLFRNLQEKSRDEIEQRFMAQERKLNPRDLKSYVYTIFDLQKFFEGFLAKRMPQAMDPDKVETFFLKEFCRLNQDLFNLYSHPSDYLVRYLIMFFDNEYAETLLLEDMERDFRFRSRFFGRTPPPAVSGAKAMALFGITKEEFKTLDKRALTRIYRKLARKHHPDKGGSHEQFVDLNNAFEALLEKIK